MATKASVAKRTMSKLVAELPLPVGVPAPPLPPLLPGLLVGTTTGVLETGPTYDHDTSWAWS